MSKKSSLEGYTDRQIQIVEAKNRIKADRRLQYRMFGFTGAILLVIFMIIPLFTGSSSKIKSTKIGKSEEIGQAVVKNTFRTYNPKSGLMVLKYRISDDESQTVAPVFKFDIKQWQKKNIRFDCSVYHTSSNHYTIVIRNVDRDFKALRVQPIATGDKVDSEGADGTDTSTKIVENEAGLNNSRLKEKSVSEYTLEDADSEITINQNNIKKHKAAIVALNKDIKAMQTSINSMKADNIYKISADRRKNQSKINSLNDSIKDDRTGDNGISDQNVGIKNDKARIRLLKQMKNDIHNGIYDFSAVTK